MGQCCGNCRYFRLDADCFPCVECSRASNDSSITYWAADLKDMSDPDEKLGAILENQTYLLFEIRRLRAKLDELMKKE